MMRRYRSNAPVRMDDDDWWEPPVIYGIGSCYDLRQPDPRNPRLIGLKSVSYNAAVALRKPAPAPPPLGFHIPRARR